MGHLLSGRRGLSSGDNRVAALSWKRTGHILRTASQPVGLEQSDGEEDQSEMRSRNTVRGWLCGTLKTFEISQEATGEFWVGG